VTSEHKLVVGVDDIKAVTFECLSCETRISIPFEKLNTPPRACSSCNAIWWSGQDISTNVSTSGPAILGLIQALVTIRVLMREKKNNCRILFELEEPAA
jgi:hypothetical protein